MVRALRDRNHNFGAPGQLYNPHSVHIVTIEDPIELFTEIKAEFHKKVGSDTTSFHEALRRVVRQSPDVILIGEMQDQESFS